MSDQVVNDQFGTGKRTVQAVAAVNEAGQVIGGASAPMVVAPNVTRGAGAVTADTQRVTLASDGPGVASLTSIDAKVLTDTQLRASPVSVVVGSRVCLKTYSVALTDTSQTLAQVIGEAIPAGAVTCEIQAQGGTIRIKRDGGTVTASAGYRLDDGVKEVVDSVLADIRLIRQSAITTVANLAFFNRV